ncbi:MAG TPA: Wzz/FepE/Etk N-terminal domain-containing protein [Baekduia sp.]|uniref:Wzz/FepE/Etk N-terminal domain-containing protein n=1 Tax=Baekduia sp. TaxID=2600305 RepID=UPI002BA0937F|nr:Wzz/FepE/Etk N-terminal domain-containing protein [Baekduia sp.]HMJ34654.1 Wzz/FepE/Etk N-terminal domain-containing protein [Baekduia sp.]
MNDAVDTGSSRTTLQTYVRVLRRQWWVPAITTVVAMLAATAYTQTATPQYSASTKIVVGQSRALFGADASGAVQPFTQTMTDLLQSDVVARETIKERNLDITPQALLSRLKVTSNPDTSVLQVSFEDPDADRAAQTLSTIANTFVRLVDQQQAGRTDAAGATTTTPPNTSGSSAPVSATVFDPAHPDPDQVSPHVKRTLVLALLLGLVTGVLLAFLRDVLSGRIRSEEEAAEAFGATVLAPLPPAVLGTKPSQVAFLPKALAGQVAESVQLLAASLRFSGASKESGVIVVTSARPQDGKSTVVAHISAALARTGGWVVAVEADMYRPTLHRLLDIEPAGPGLTDVLSGDRRVEDILVDVPVGQLAGVGAGAGGADDHQTRLQLLPAGTPHPLPAELLSLGTTGELIAHLRSAADYVVVDTPPMLLSGDSFPLLQVADQVIVVCREGETSRDEAQSVRARLSSLGIKNYSVVLTNSSQAQQRAYGYSYAD